VLVGSARAIVTEIPGTTRDLVSETVNLNGLAVTMVDTAGDRDAVDIVEREGVARAARARAVADLLLIVCDASEPATADDERLLAVTAGQPRIVVRNKVDMAPRRAAPADGADAALAVSAKTGAGIPELRCAIVAALTGGEPLRDASAISNIRHIRLLEQAREHLESAEKTVATAGAPEEIVLSDLQAARTRLGEIVGVRTSEDVLEHIFARFCIGK
jgi:tRNA modification GTPase